MRFLTLEKAFIAIENFVKYCHTDIIPQTPHYINYLTTMYVFILENGNCKNILHLWKRDLRVESLARNVMTGSKAPSRAAQGLLHYPATRASELAFPPLSKLLTFARFAREGGARFCPAESAFGV